MAADKRSRSYCTRVLRLDEATGKEKVGAETGEWADAGTEDMTDDEEGGDEGSTDADCHGRIRRVLVPEFVVTVVCEGG